VPFGIEVRPLAVEPDSSKVRRLSDERALVGVLRGAQRAGASMIVVGSTSEESQEGRSTAAEEQSDSGRDGGLMSSDALAEMARCGLYPVAWSGARGPEPAAGAKASACSTVLERRDDDSEEGLSPALPFLILSDRCDKRVLPANLPVLAEGRGEVETILEAARRAAAVPDPWVTVRIAAGTPARSVGLLFSGLRAMDYGFSDLRYARNLTADDTLHVETVEMKRLLADLVPEGWETEMIGPEAGAREVIHADDEARKEKTLVRPGAIVVSYPPDAAPKVVLSFEGDAREVTQRAVYRLAHLIVILGISAAALLLVLYVAQSLQRRGA